METGHSVYIQIIFTRRDGGQVHKHFQLIDICMVEKKGKKFSYHVGDRLVHHCPMISKKQVTWPELQT